MAVEKLTEEQIKKAEDTESICAQSLVQKAKQEAVEQAKKAKEELDKATQQLAELPEKAIKSLNEAVDTLLSVINGHVNVNSPDFKPEEIVAKLQSLLNPVLSALSSLPVPKIPGLAQIADLLAALKALIASNSSKSGQLQPPSAEIPPELMNMLRDLLAALQSLCTTLPLVLINLIFQMLNTIVKLFKQIAGILGVPSIPFPLNIVSNCISIMPDIMNFALSVPGQLVNATYGSIKRVFGQIADLQIPAPPDQINNPEGLPVCPKHAKEAAQKDEGKSSTAQQNQSSGNSSSTSSNDIVEK